MRNDATERSQKQKLSKNIPYPIGTREEVKRLVNLDPAAVPTCSKPEKDAHGNWLNKGCRQWNTTCELDGGITYGKELPVIKGNGPRNLGCRAFKDTPTGWIAIRRVLPCYAAVRMAQRIELNGGVFEILADEGEMFEQETTRTRDEIMPGQTPVRHVENIIERKPVPAFPRPEQNRALLSHVIATRELGNRSETDRLRRLQQIKEAAIAGGVQMRVAEDFGDDYVVESGGADPPLPAETVPAADPPAPQKKPRG